MNPPASCPPCSQCPPPLCFSPGGEQHPQLLSGPRGGCRCPRKPCLSPRSALARGCRRKMEPGTVLSPSSSWGGLHLSWAAQPPAPRGHAKPVARAGLAGGGRVAAPELLGRAGCRGQPPPLEHLRGWVCSPEQPARQPAPPGPSGCGALLGLARPRSRCRGAQGCHRGRPGCPRGSVVARQRFGRNSGQASTGSGGGGALPSPQPPDPRRGVSPRHRGMAGDGPPSHPPRRCWASAWGRL